MTFIEKQNPAFKEHHVESSRPGELLCQDTFYVGWSKGVEKGLVVRCGGHVHQLRVRVSVQDENTGVNARSLVGAVLKDNSWEFCGASHPYKVSVWR